MIKDIIESLQKELYALPTISRQKSEDLCFHILDNPNIVEQLSTIFQKAASLKRCQQCNSISIKNICKICEVRDSSKSICLVESIQDLLKIEFSKEYRGKYHILKGPQEIYDRITKEGIEEIIFALGNGVESRALVLEMAEKIDVKKSRIATGIPLGAKMSGYDLKTIASAMKNREEI